MEKPEIFKQLNISFEKLIYWLDNHPQHKFSEVIIEGKWTAGQHIQHLLQSTKPVNTIMKMPKLFLRYKWGTCNRPERTFDALVNKYETKLSKNTQPGPKRFQPPIVSAAQKSAIIEKLDSERHKMIRIASKWSEKALSKYVIPHPLLGKLSVREMLYFTILHTDHHRLILKKKY
ncbi:MAG: DinB family protein [Saprospiraceae bacterium]|nr:DinB family protein [Bacteroidia bacterium]NNL91402.1 DinB family protein [Saprospiraceae bacterium]